MTTPTDREILDARTKKLAQRASAASAIVEETAELMFFTAGDLELAVGLACLIAVTRLGDIEAVPDAPAVFRGVTTHRGKVLAVVDLRALLTGTPSTSVSTGTLVLGRGRPEIAVTIDHADEVVRVPSSRIDATAMATWHDRAAFASGLIAGRRLVLDARLLLDDPRLTAAGVER